MSRIRGIPDEGIARRTPTGIGCQCIVDCPTLYP
jgi:hypothetical protein